MFAAEKALLSGWIGGLVCLRGGELKDEDSDLDNSRPLEPLRSLAVVLPRYGASLGGGAETLTRELVLKVCGGTLSQFAPLVPKVEVWSTCARDHRTWENYYPEGICEEDGLIVRRFAVSKRDLETFIRAELAMQDGRPLSIDEQLDWLSSGVNSPGLYHHIKQHAPEFDALLFAPYLFATSFWGALIYPERSIMIPCLHNEHYAYLDVFHHLVRSVRGFMFNAPGEMELAKALFGEDLIAKKGGVVGMGFEFSEEAPENKERSQLSYLLYSGRKETGKNLDLLIDCFSYFKKQNPESELELKIIGSGSIDFLKELPAGVTDCGFVTEEEKISLMRGALALCQPSVNESFSIVLMEAWREGTAVIVHAGCAVTREHAEAAGGGLYFSNKEEFVEVLRELLARPGLAEKLGLAGRRYVQSEYSWGAVRQRFIEVCTLLGYCFDGESAEETSDAHQGVPQ